MVELEWMNLFLGDASSTFATMVFCGYLYLSLVQVVGAIFGDDAPVQVLFYRHS